MKTETEENCSQIDRLVEAVLESPKYRNISTDFIRNIGTRELSKCPNLKSAIKLTKNKLHQVAGAYFLQRPDYKLWIEKLRDANKSGDQALFRTLCSGIMGCHYSTRQRLPILEQLHERIFSLVPSVRSIMDVACGFHPLSIPWMPLKPRVKYYAFDVYRDLADFLNEFLALAGVQGHAETADVTQNPPKLKTDLAFVLSTLPCFERIEKSAGLRVLESIRADFLVVSFPAKSLCGKEKSMQRHYKAAFNRLTEGKDWIIREMEFEEELVFLVDRTSAC